jgi:Niemann-Pick C1 protein
MSFCNQQLENPKEYVDEIDIYVTEDYLIGTYESCKSVIVPSTGSKAIGFMCGSAGVLGCNPNVWYSFLGNVTSTFVPFQINYKKYPNNIKKVDNFTPINPVIKRCDESIDGIKPPCSCMDCALNYIESSSTKVTSQEFIFGLSPHTFLMICVFLIGTLAFLIISSFENDKHGKFK